MLVCTLSHNFVHYVVRRTSLLCSVVLFIDTWLWYYEDSLEGPRGERLYRSTLINPS